ncbi:hypothetical protein FHR24_001072 [Wenyingzhuangia heitensis]|uniref:Uncharacterized protein n=1 Tax=Wenyingzhuangia heitensis TaxID=1487859 RepID=A0ABX0U796_9FLAO|nr:hypothetical protein [Wenyingzhuangia heitensis]
MFERIHSIGKGIIDQIKIELVLELCKYIK